MSFCCYYLEIETVPYPEFMDYPGANTDPSKAKIISIQYCPLHTHNGEPIGDIKILSDWRKNRSEKIILDLFRKIFLDGGCWAFVPVGINLAYECEFLEYKFRLFCGLSGLKLAQRPMIDIKPIQVCYSSNKRPFKSLICLEKEKLEFVTENIDKIDRLYNRCSKPLDFHDVANVINTVSVSDFYEE